MKIIKDIKNDLMNRREVNAEIEADKTPSFAEAAKLVAEHFKANEDHIMIEQVKGSFGVKKFIIKASIYGTKEAKDESFKRLTKQKKEKVVEAPAAA